MLRECRFKTRDEVAAIRLVVGVLELATAAFRKMAAGCLLVMRARRKRSIIEKRISRNAERHMSSAQRHPVSARGDADDQFVHQRSSRARGIDSARSSAIISGPAI